MFEEFKNEKFQSFWTGADMSVLPMSYCEAGRALNQKSILRDAQGNLMPGGALRRAVVEMEDDQGNVVRLRETFALSKVSEPLVALGKLLKHGWRVEGDGEEVKLACENFSKTIGFRSNSLSTMAKIRLVELPKENKVRAVTMSFEGMMMNMLTVPGWHLSIDRRVPFLVVMNSNHHHNSFPQFQRTDFPFRTTLILKDKTWEVVEMADRSNSEDEIEECNGELTTIVVFFHRNEEEVLAVGKLSTGADDPFLRPKMLEDEPKSEEARERQGFGWHGRTLEDGVYEVDESDAEMGPQHETGEGDPVQREYPQPADGEGPEEIEIEGVKYTPDTTLSKMRVALKLCGLPKGRSKADAWKRLVDHHQHFSENLAVELAQREFTRRRLDEGGGDARGQHVPRVPTKAERQLHELTHWPYEEWCQSCVAARAKADPHKLQGSVRDEAKSEYPIVSMDFAFTKSLVEPEEEDREDLQRYGGDARGGVSLVITDDWTRGILVVPTPGKGRAHIKFLAEQVVRYIGSCGFSTCTVKADAEPSTRLLLDVISKCRQRLGFKTLVEHSGPDDSQGNGRVEREIQTVRGLAKTLISRLREGAGVQINVYGPLFQWALRHAGWLITHFRRRNGSPTAYEQVTGRKYQGKLALFGERVLARLPGNSGDDRFRPAVWLGKTDKADFHMVATSDGLRWTRTVRRLPVPFDAAVLNNVRTWPWSVSYGQIGTKSTPLLTKTENVALPPELSRPLRLQEKQERKQALADRAQARQQAAAQPAIADGVAGEAGQDEAASDPSSRQSSKHTSSSTSSLSMSVQKELDDDTLLEELVGEVNENKQYAGGVETSPKRGGAVVPEEEQSPTKTSRVSPRKAMRTSGPGEQPDAGASSSAPAPQPAGEPQVRMVVGGELLEDGDQDMEFPDKPPELSPDELVEVENKAAETEIQRLIEMGVLRRAQDGEDLASTPTLTTRLVCDWRFRDGAWQRRARLVARDFNWLDPNRSDTFAPTGTQSTMRLIPLLCQLRQWRMVVADVKDAYLNCEQPKSVKVVLSADLAGRLGVEREWMLGKVLPGQREGAAVWFGTLKSTLKDGGLLQCPEAPTVWTNASKTLALMTHVDDMVMTGEDAELEKIESFLKQKFKMAVETGNQLSFLKRSIEVVDGKTKIRMNEQYIEGLVNLFNGVKKRRTPGDIIIDNEPLVNEQEIQKYRSAIGTLLYVSGDRPDVQFFIKELASHLQVPTKGAMRSLVNLVGHMVSTKDLHVELTGTNHSRSFRHRAEGLTDAPQYEEKDGIWLLEVATDSDWSGNKETRSSTSSGSIYLGGNWLHSYARTQKHITLSSTESEFVALVGGASEGLFLRAVIQHLVDGEVELKIYGDNTSSIAVASRDGVGRLKHVSGRLLWIQQRQQCGDLQLRRIDTITNTADVGTKVLPGRRVKLLMYLCGFANDWGDLGCAEFEEEKLKKQNKERIKAVRKLVCAEALETNEKPSSTLVNQVAKRLMRLTLGALLLSGGEALSLPHQSSPQCLVEVEMTSTSSPMATTMLVVVVFILVIAIVILLKIMHVMHLKVEATRNTMDWVRQQLRQNRDRRMIRSQEQQRLGVGLKQMRKKKAFEKIQKVMEVKLEMERKLRRVCIETQRPRMHIRRMTKEEFYPRERRKAWNLSWKRSTWK